MANQYAINYNMDINTPNNAFSTIWKLTRCMKAAGWTYKASGDGLNKDTTGVATNDLWGGNVNPMSDIYPVTIIAPGSDNVSAAGATINVVSTTGFPSSGRFNIGTINTNVTYTGKTATSFTGCSGGSGTMRYNQAVSLLDTYAAWWCAEGPSTVKLGINTVSTGTFSRGEIVFQAGTGATGELLGYVVNSAGNSGWIVIMPQTGTFNSSGQITGTISKAVITPVSYNLIRRQVVIAKTTNVTDGWIFYETLSDTEITASSNTALFSDLAANAANCTGSVAPGNSSSGSNRFPLYGIACIGTAESTAKTFFGHTGLYGKSHMAAVNATPGVSTSADGSFWITIWDANQGSATYKAFGLQRLDNTEPGDVDPFAFYCGYTTDSAGSLASRLTGTTADTPSVWNNNSFGGAAQTPVATPFKGYCARTTGTIGIGADQYVPLCAGVVSSSPLAAFTAQFTNNAAVMRIRNHPDNATANSPMYIEMLSVHCIIGGLSIRKGTCRWLGIVSTGWYNDIYNGQWLTIGAGGYNGVSPAIVIGPLDGVTIPVVS